MIRRGVVPDSGWRGRVASRVKRESTIVLAEKVK